MRNILIVAGGVVAVAAIAAGVYFGTRPPAAGPPPVAVAADAGQVRPARRPAERPCAGRPQGADHPDRVRLLHLPALRPFPHADPARDQEEVDRHRQGEADLPRLPARPGRRPRRPRSPSAPARTRYFGVIDLIFSSQPSWATASDPIAELAKPLRIAGMGENEIKACLANEAMSQRGDRRLSRRRDAGRQLDADALHQRRTLSRARARSRNSTRCSASSPSRSTNRRGVDGAVRQTPALRLQVLRRSDGARHRARHDRHRRPQRLRQVEPRRGA